jgi:hypothetical protein
MNGMTIAEQVPARRRLGDLLVDSGVLTLTQLREALAAQ